jgi:hypothetical protein
LGSEATPLPASRTRLGRVHCPPRPGGELLEEEEDLEAADLEVLETAAEEAAWRPWSFLHKMNFTGFIFCMHVVCFMSYMQFMHFKCILNAFLAFLMRF